MPITSELLDELLKDYKSPDDMFGNDGLLQQLTKAVVERALQGEMTHHLGYERHDPAGARLRQLAQWQVEENHQRQARADRDRCPT